MQFILIILMTLLGSCASIFLKKASGGEGLKEILTNINLYLGGGLYFISAICNILILRLLSYSIVLPLTSITYVWTMILSYIMLHEHISKKKIVGVFAIVLGAIVMVM